MCVKVLALLLSLCLNTTNKCRVHDFGLIYFAAAYWCVNFLFREPTGGCCFLCCTCNMYILASLSQMQQSTTATRRTAIQFSYHYYWFCCCECCPTTLNLFISVAESIEYPESCMCEGFGGLINKITLLIYPNVFRVWFIFENTEIGSV